MDVYGVLKKHSEFLFTLPNLIGFSNTFKKRIRGGVEVDEKVLRIYVSKKVPREYLSRDELIPASIDGIPTDVVEIGELKFKYTPRDRLRPAPCGVSTGLSNIRIAGTIGWWIQDSDFNLYLMSNYHVWGETGNVIQPSLIHGGTAEDVIGSVYYGAPISFTGENRVDVSIATVDLDKAYMSILEIGGVTGVGLPTLGEMVQKTGATTGYTVGEVIDESATVNVKYDNQTALFTDVFLVEGVDIVDAGDSGSPVLNMQNKFYGLLFAGNDDGTIYVSCKYSNIEDVLSSNLEKRFKILVSNSPKPYEVEVVYVQPKSIIETVYTQTFSLIQNITIILFIFTFIRMFMTNLMVRY